MTVDELKTFLMDVPNTAQVIVVNLPDCVSRCYEHPIKDAALVNSYSGGYRLILVADYSV